MANLTRLCAGPVKSSLGTHQLAPDVSLAGHGRVSIHQLATAKLAPYVRAKPKKRQVAQVLAPPQQGWGRARTAFSARRPPQRGRFSATQVTRIARHPKVSFERIVVSLLGVADDMRRVAGMQWPRGLQCLVEWIGDQMLAGWRAAWSRTTLCSEQGCTCS